MMGPGAAPHSAPRRSDLSIGAGPGCRDELYDPAYFDEPEPEEEDEEK